jgi:tol-pal system protein YbgF
MTVRRRMMRLGLLPVLLLGGCITKQGIVMPWTMERRSLERRFDSRLDSLETVIAGLDEARRADDLELRAQLSGEIAASGERIDILGAKLDDYVARLTRIAQRASRPAPESGSAPRAELEPAALYNQAYGDYTRGRYDLARQQFEDFLKRFAGSELADNARYWLGECYYDQEQVPQAETEFQKVVDDYPDSDKAPAAALKLGLCRERLNDKPGAIAKYRAVIAKFPQTQEARLAEENLRRLQQ